MHFSSVHSWFLSSVCYYLQCSFSLDQRVIQRVKNHFLVTMCFNSCIIINRSQMYTSEKNTKHLTVRGGSTLFFPPKVNADCELCRQSVLHTVQVLNTMSCISEICALYRFLDTEKIAVCNITTMHASPCSLLRTVTTDINYFQCSLYTRSFEC